MGRWMEWELLGRDGKDWGGGSGLALVADEVAGYTRSRCEDREARRALTRGKLVAHILRYLGEE